MTATHSKQTEIECSGCDAQIRTPLPDGTEPVDFAPDGLVRATCAKCGEGVAVGFERTDT